MNEISRPAYYAIIPSEVRYCEELKFPERLLYGEITSLAGKEGYCFATNRYFAELYHVIPGTISRWISHLEKLGFIRTEIITDDKNQIIERRIYINNIYKDAMPNTYKQNKQYPYEQDRLYSISRTAKDNNINNKIDRLFNYFIKNTEDKYEEFTKENEIEFRKVLKQLDLNYTEEILQIFRKENIEKIKTIIYALKEIYVSNKKALIYKIKRDELVSIYDKCKEKQIEYQGTSRELVNFFDYYYSSLIKSLEKA